MTGGYTYKKAKNSVKLRRLSYVYMSLFIILLFFKNSDVASVWVSDGLALCAKKLIPSLFPFMVISSLVVSSGLGRIISHIFKAPVRALLGLGEECASALLLGWLCGFPLGAKCASELYAKGRINTDEYNRILCICSTPSPAFLISAVGASMLGSKKYGIWLYALSLLSALCVGIFLRIRRPISHRSCSISSTQEERVGFARSLTRAVSDAGVGMLSVCAFVVFFSAFLGALDATLSFLPLSDTAHSLLFSFFELTSGLSKICTLRSVRVFPLCALAVGWSGLSVHFQTMSICGSTESANFKGYMLSHAARTLICFVLALLADSLFL